MVDTKAPLHNRKWSQMNGGERVICLAQWMVTLATFGFVFPHSMDPFIKDEPPKS